MTLEYNRNQNCLKNLLPIQCKFAAFNKEKLRSIDPVAIMRNSPYLVTKVTLSLFGKSAKQLEIYF